MNPVLSFTCVSNLFFLNVAFQVPGLARDCGLRLELLEGRERGRVFSLLIIVGTSGLPAWDVLLSHNPWTNDKH